MYLVSRLSRLVEHEVAWVATNLNAVLRTTRFINHVDQLPAHIDEMVAAQQDEHGWKSALVDVGDYFVVLVKLLKPVGRQFVLRLQCDDYPEIAPELRFVAPGTFADPSAEAQLEDYPRGNHIVAAGERGPLPVPCIKGHRDYYAGGWHGGWTNPPAHDHSLYQLVVNIRNAILDHWS